MAYLNVKTICPKIGTFAAFVSCTECANLHLLTVTQCTFEQEAAAHHPRLSWDSCLNQDYNVTADGRAISVYCCGANVIWYIDVACPLLFGMRSYYIAGSFQLVVYCCVILHMLLVPSAIIAPYITAMH